MSIHLCDRPVLWPSWRRARFTDHQDPRAFGPTGRTGSMRRLDLPVLFTTGCARNAIIRHGWLDPHVNLLNKPYAQQELPRKVRELLDRRASLNMR